MPSLPQSLTEAMAETVEQTERVMDSLLPRPDGMEGRLFAAMRHGALGGGKRLRPFLLMEGAKLFGVAPDCALRAAAALEFVHCYSLIHDDLPAMDNSPLRRGRETVHVAFDEATAILAGDGLLTLAFETLADPRTHEDAQTRCRLIAALARAAGSRGMVGGQMLDLIAETTTLDIGAITRLQRLKTGEMIAFSAMAGAIMGRAGPPQLHALQAYAHDLGLAFQIADDLLDIEGRSEETGKPVGLDVVAKKATFVSILGAERARDQARRLADQATQHLEIFDDRARLLAQVAQFVVERRG
jgi:farnesyl diphosphate synthase